MLNRQPFHCNRRRLRSEQKVRYRNSSMVDKRTLAAQLVIIAICAFALAELAINFPFPSPIIKPLLTPKLRWPTEQVEQWVESTNFDSGFLEFFARDPERFVPAGNNMVSPADGVVKNLVYRGGTTYLVIGLSFWDVHVVRTPADGIVKNLEQEGLYFARTASKQELRESVFLRGKAAPVQQIVTVGTRFSNMKVRLITSYWASRLKVWVHLGQRLQKGQRIGRILLGSTVVLEIPGKVALPVRIGQRVTGGATIIYQARGQR
jgi:phosphatidylserine decarboxylase